MTRAGRWQRCLVLVVGLALCGQAQAGFFDRMTFFRNWSAKNRVDTLLITGNYAKSRLLGELVQHKTKQPIILISPSTGGATELFFLPSGPEAMAIEAGKYVEFVDFLKPKRVLFVGGDNYTPTAFVDQLRDRYPTVLVTSNDWQKNAEALATLTKDRRLPKKYMDYLIQLGEFDGQPPVGVDLPTAPGGIPEPIAAPRSVVPTGTLGR
ncbi:MAG: hypothetical protein HN742_02615 [Lentisphaerae bacterium]|jgi:hypothetical protein|nr:hypothetical protein [Lentisphaerota bacterium]MBT4818201.1 hypothetical protein [Lentisphaerota bacterium]MBT5608031.1 hypothetical protein [Lentisphaerota bacterium]MBT7056501.1 hypothetical protein [Lentisphaerota bacterium]MBT7840732.1 hypothetical protein [Lentisphaerota bacterium]